MKWDYILTEHLLRKEKYFYLTKMLNLVGLSDSVGLENKAEKFPHSHCAKIIFREFDQNSLSGLKSNLLYSSKTFFLSLNLSSDTFSHLSCSFSHP